MKILTLATHAYNHDAMPNNKHHADVFVCLSFCGFFLDKCAAEESHQALRSEICHQYEFAWFIKFILKYNSEKNIFDLPKEKKELAQKKNN